jgi:hypothetical protein
LPAPKPASDVGVDSVHQHGKNRTSPQADRTRRINPPEIRDLLGLVDAWELLIEVQDLIVP